MMQRAILGAALAMTLGGVGVAQAAASSPPAPGAPAFSASMSQGAPPRPLAHRPRRGFKPGMVVLDRRGDKVGVISQPGQFKDGRPAMLIDVDGTPIRVLRSKFKLTRDGEEAVVSLTRSQIRTSQILNSN